MRLKSLTPAAAQANVEGRPTRGAEMAQPRPDGQKFIVTKDTVVADVLERVPGALELLVSYGFAPLADPVMRRTVTPHVTLETGSRVHAVDLGALLRDLNRLAEQGATDKRGGRPRKADAAAPSRPEGRANVNVVQVLNALRNCRDPEVPFNIVDLGLVYDVRFEGERVVISMTLTNIDCALAGQAVAEAAEAVCRLGVSAVEVKLVREPAWDPSRMAPVARAALGQSQGRGRARLPVWASAGQNPPGVSFLEEMENMKATEVLSTEHRAIERMLAVLEAAAGRLESGERVRPGLLRDAVDFVRNFADRCHHGKEEANLFPRLEARGLPSQEGPLAVMLHEHDQGRAYVGGMADALDAYEAGDQAAARTIAENARGYAGLLREHIMKEDSVLFPMADRLLSADDQRELEQRFEQVETEIMGPGVHERYHQLLDDLEREMGLG